jgi:hypothetical protein
MGIEEKVWHERIWSNEQWRPKTKIRLTEKK